MSKTDYMIGFFSALLLHAVAFFLLGMIPAFNQQDRAEVQPPIDTLTLSLIEEVPSDNPAPQATDTAPRPQPDPELALHHLPTPLPEQPMFKELSSDIFETPRHPFSDLATPPPVVVIATPSALPDKTVLPKLATILTSQDITDPSSRSSDSKGGLPPGALIAPVPKDQSINPKYPMAARRRGEQGRVIIDVSVSKAGKAASVSLVSSSGFKDLDIAAQEAVLHATFTPGERNGKPVEASARMTILFQLNQN